MLPAPDEGGDAPGLGRGPECETPGPAIELALGRPAVEGREGPVTDSQMEKATERPADACRPRGDELMAAMS